MLNRNPANLRGALGSKLLDCSGRQGCHNKTESAHVAIPISNVMCRVNNSPKHVYKDGEVHHEHGARANFRRGCAARPRFDIPRRVLQLLLLLLSHAFLDNVGKEIQSL